MAKDPAFLFYTGDFSTGTQFFSDDQLGKYLRLLMAQHQHGRLTEKQMLFICKSYDYDVFIKFTKDDKSLYYNERLEAEISKRQKFSESRSNNKSGRKTSLNKDFVSIDIKDSKIISKSYDYHMENENENKDEIIIIDEEEKKGEILKVIIWPSFENFWDAYDKKVDRKDCEKKWDKLRQPEKENILNNIPEYIKSTPDKQYRKNPETYLNDRAWENEIITTNGTTKINTARAGSSEANRDSLKQFAEESSRIFQLIASQNAS